MEVTTYNVNFSRRAVDGYEAFQWKNRSEEVYRKLLGTESDVLFIQEVHKDYLKEFVNRMNMYEWYFKPQNSRGSVTNIGVGVLKKHCLEPEFFDFNFNVFNEKCEMVVGAHIPMIDAVFISIHFPTNEQGRKDMVHNFSKCLPKDCTDKTKLVVGGDFNAFPDRWGYTQIPLLNSLLGTYSATETAVNLSDGKLAIKSFSPYPYDYVPPEALALYGKLDHILVRGWDFEAAVVDDRLMEKKNWRASDHFPVTVRFS